MNRREALALMTASASFPIGQAYEDVTLSNIRRSAANEWIRNGQSPYDVLSLVSVTGHHSAEVLVSACDLRKAKQSVTVAADIAKGSVTLANNILSGQMS